MSPRPSLLQPGHLNTDPGAWVLHLVPCRRRRAVCSAVVTCRQSLESSADLGARARGPVRCSSPLPTALGSARTDELAPGHSSRSARASHLPDTGPARSGLVVRPAPAPRLRDHFRVLGCVAEGIPGRGAGRLTVQPGERPLSRLTRQATAIRPAGTAHPGPTTSTRCCPEAFASASSRLQAVAPKSTSLVSTVPALRPGAVW